MTFTDSALADANRRVFEARERLELQRELVLKMRRNRQDTNDAVAVFRTLQRALETSRVFRHKVEVEAVRAGRVRTNQGISLGGR